MVQRDRFSGRVLWLTIILPGLILIFWLDAVWQVFAHGFTLQTMTIAGLSFGGLWPLARLLPEQWKRLKRIEAQRSNPGEAPVSAMQFELENIQSVSSLTLRSRFSFLAVVIWLVICISIEAVLLKIERPERLFELLIMLIWGVLSPLSFGLGWLLKYQRIEATPQGLLVQRGWRRRFIPWQQARLFASLRLPGLGGTSVQYELSSTQALLRWDAHYPKGMMTTTPRQRQSYEQQLRDVLSFIHLQTGLPLLDLS